MAGKSRRAKERHLPVTDEIIALFKRGRALQAAGRAYERDDFDKKHGFQGRPTAEMREIERQLDELTGADSLLLEVSVLDVDPDDDDPRYQHPISWLAAIEAALEEARQSARGELLDVG
jgi:hypothetical protein